MEQRRYGSQDEKRYSLLRRQFHQPARTQSHHYQTECDSTASQTSRDFYTVRISSQRQDLYFRLRVVVS